MADESDQLKRIAVLTDEWKLNLTLKITPAEATLKMTSGHGIPSQKWTSNTIVDVFESLERWVNECAEPLKTKMLLGAERRAEKTLDRLLDQDSANKCPVTKKSSYADETHAEKAAAWLTRRNLEAARDRIAVRSYQCEHCGQWHLTSKPWRQQ